MCLVCSILAAPPTAELEPLANGQVSQIDEVAVVALSPCFGPVSLLLACLGWAPSQPPFCPGKLSAGAGCLAWSPGSGSVRCRPLTFDSAVWRLGLGGGVT